MGLNTEQLELEIQRILFKGDTPLVLYALQIARERKVNLRREIIENLINSKSTLPCEQFGCHMAVLATT